jgi:hypothetical protein
MQCNAPAADNVWGRNSQLNLRRLRVAACWRRPWLDDSGPRRPQYPQSFAFRGFVSKACPLV